MLTVRATNPASASPPSLSGYSASSHHRRSNLPNQLQSVVPSCAQSCISTYISQEFETCASDDFSCLCSQYSSEGYTLGELTYGCLNIACDQQTIIADQYNTYYVCAGKTETVTATHTPLILPSTTATSILSSVTSTQTSSSSEDASTTSTVPSVQTTSASPEPLLSASTSSTSISSSGLMGAASSTSSAISTAFPTTGSSELTTAQAVGVTVAVFSTVILIVALSFLFASIRRRRSFAKLGKVPKRDSYDFIDDAPAHDSVPSDSNHGKHYTAYSPSHNHGSNQEKKEDRYAPGYSTIHPVPRSRGSEKRQLDLDPFADHALVEPPKLAVYSTNSPASEHNSMLLPEKPPLIGPPPPPQKSYQAPAKLKPSVMPTTSSREDVSQASVANFSRPALPAQPKEVFLPSNPKTKLAQPPALARREQPQQQMRPAIQHQSASPYQVPPLRPAQQPPQYALQVTSSPESTRKVSLSLDIPRQAKKSVSASPPVQVFPATSARGIAGLRIVNKTPSPKVPAVQQDTQQELYVPPQTQKLGPRSSAMSAQVAQTPPPPPPSRPQSGRSTASSSLARSQHSATTDNVLSYYTSPIPSRDSHLSSPTTATPIEEDAQRRKAVPTAITVTKPTHPPRAVRANPRNSGGSDTSFESINSDEPTPPDEYAPSVKPLSPVQELHSHQLQQSPIAAIRYPKIPRSSNQIVPRSPGKTEPGHGNDKLSPTYASPMKSAGLANLIEQSNASPQQQVRREVTPEQQKIDTSMLSGSTLAVKRRGDGEAKKFTINTSRSGALADAQGRTRPEESDENHKVTSARSIAQRESPLKGYGRVTSFSGNAGGGRRTPHSATQGGLPRSGDQPYSADQKQFSPNMHAQPKQRKVPQALMIGNGFQPPKDGAAQHDVVLKSPLLQFWEPKLTPSRRGDDLFLEVSLATPV